MVKAYWFDWFSVNRAYHFIVVLGGSNLMFVTLVLADSDKGGEGSSAWHRCSRTNSNVSGPKY